MYALYLLTPLPNPQTQAERRYNFAHSSTRMVIERFYGVLKRRFPCLASLLRFIPQKCSVVIIARAVLHNLALENADNDIDIDDMDNSQNFNQAIQGVFQCNAT